MRHWLFLIGIVVSIGLSPHGRALAQETDSGARALFLSGQEAYSQGDYETAIEKWKAAYQADARPLIQYNLGQAYERLGRIQDAAAALDLYLQTAPEDDRTRRAEVSAKLERLRNRLAQTGVIIVGGPDSAAIFVDGQKWGMTPRPDAIDLEPGSHHIEVRKEGFEDFKAVISVGAGKRVEVAVEMAAKPMAEESAATKGASSEEFPLGPVLVMGGGGLLAAGGLVLGLVASGKASDAAASTGSDADSARGLALGADILIFGGLAVAAGGFIWLLLSDDGDEGQAGGSDPALAVTPWATGHSGGVTATVGF
ncbi:MAG: PEGA domain-containing protein [Myxococcales bacterium]|nr:PEGA domain-containing protein [Myxococcales bacterium]